MPLLPVGGVGKVIGITNPVSFGVQIVGTLLSVLFGGLFGGGSNNQLRRDVDALREQMSKAIDVTQRFAWKGVFTTGTLLLSLQKIWNTVLRPMLDKIEQLARRLASIYTRVIVPLLNALAKIKKFLDDFYLKYLRPVLNAIQIVRKYLAILKLFNIKWAGALDDKLAYIEGRIIGPYLWVLKQLNGYASWINIIITAGGAIQRVIFLNSLWRYRSDVAQVFWSSQTSSGAGAVVWPAKPKPTIQDSSQAAFDYVRVNGGRLAPQIDRGVNRFRSLMQGGV